LIAEGVLTNKQILERVKANHPLRKTTYACVAWYQSKMKAEAAAVGGELERIAAAKEVAEVEAKAWADKEAQMLLDIENEKRAADELAASKKKGK
jgi:hypothetical protein